MNWKLPVSISGIVVALALALCNMTKLTFWASLAAVVVCLVVIAGSTLLNGYIATIEDEWPGGFNNPNPPPSETQRRVAQVTERVLRRVFRILD